MKIDPGLRARTPSTHKLRLLGALLAAAALAAPASSAGPPLDADGFPLTAERPREYDRHGRVVRDEHGRRHSYGRPENPGPPPGVGRSAAADPGDPPAELAGDAPSELQPRAGGPIPVELEWHRVIYGVGIGDTGLHVADLDGDGAPEVVAAAGPYGFFANDYWYVLDPVPGGYDYPHRWSSLQYGSAIRSVRTADLDDDGDHEVLVGVGSQILIYDGLDPVLTQTVATAASQIRGLRVADVDGDGSEELVFCDASRLFVHDLATGAQEYQGSGFGGLDLAVGDVDGDGDLEIVVGNGTNTGYVLDGATRAVEWSHAAGFGTFVRLGDLDADGKEEIVAGYRWNDVDVYDADLQTLAWTLPVSNDLAALQVLDADGDGALEIVYGDGQWGSLYSHDGATGALEWSVPNPEHGVTDLAVADTDGDGDAELLWGAGYTSSGADYLFAVDSWSLLLEWQSTDVSGPFYGLDHGDLDDDGNGELIYTSFESESGYGDGLYFVHDAASKELEFQSLEPSASNFTGLWRVVTADVDADPQEEILVTTGAGYTGRIVCYDGASHTQQWQAASENGLGFRSLAVADVDGDGALEVAAATGREHTGPAGVYLYLFDATTGTLEWRSPSLGTGFVDYPLLRLADVDGDGVTEMLVGSDGGELQVFDGVTHALELATADLDLTALDTPDRDGDGTAEILVGTAAGLLRVLDPATGAVVETVGSYGAPIDGLAVADLDYDGTADYLFGVAGEVRAVSGTGGVLWASGDLGSGVGALDSLRLADLDDDGALEIFVNLGVVGMRVYTLNTSPQVTITAPAGGTVVNDGDAVTFTATATDDEDGDLTANLQWSSSLDGPIGSGASFATSALSVGTHTVTASVTDANGAPGEDAVTVTVNAYPTVTVTAPASGTVVNDGDPVTFTANATDPEDGDLSADLQWSSSLDGPIGAGASFATSALSVGVHTVTASVTDADGAPDDDVITVTVNAYPTVTVTAPASGTVVDDGDPVTFTANATDPEDGDLSANVQWSSSLDGPIGAGASFATSALSVGTHTVTASVTDADGAPDDDVVTVTVNAYPTVTVTAPANGTVVDDGDPVTFTANATDPEDGDLSADLQWSSSLDGPIGSGASFVTAALSIGVHTVTASVTDGNGAPGDDVVTVTVNAYPTVTVTAPTSGTVVDDGDPVTFTANATDPEDGDLSANVQWSSSLDGPIGSGASFVTSALSIGVHNVTASVTDGNGAPGDDVVTVTVNAYPTVTVTAPADGALFPVGVGVGFAGVASDPEDGDLTAGIQWSSNLDGPIGSGGSFTTSALSAGDHTVTATVTDANGAPASDVVTLRIAVPVVVTFTSIAPEDGWIRESDENTSAGGANDAGSGGDRALRIGDDQKDRQYLSVVSFDTSSLPAGAVLLSAELRLRRGRLFGNNPFATHGTCRVDVATGALGATTALADGDFEAAADAVAAAVLSEPLADLDWSEGFLDAAGLAAIDVAGTTQFRVYFEVDDNDDRRSDFMGYYSAEDGDPANHPRLEVEYIQ